MRPPRALRRQHAPAQAARSASATAAATGSGSGCRGPCVQRACGGRAGGAGVLTVRSMRAQVTPASSSSASFSTVWHAGPTVIATAWVHAGRCVSLVQGNLAAPIWQAAPRAGPAADEAAPPPPPCPRMCAAALRRSVGLPARQKPLAGARSDCMGCAGAGRSPGRRAAHPPGQLAAPRGRCLCADLDSLLVLATVFLVGSSCKTWDRSSSLKK